jgi:voltage-gated potassium channel
MVKVLAVLLLLPFATTVAFMVVEGWSFLDSLYMAVITLTTVGFNEVHPLDTGGRIIVLVSLFLGLGLTLFGVAYLGEYLLQVRLGDLRGRKKMENAINNLKDHLIICGRGRMGKTLCDQLKAAGETIVIVDKDAENVERAVDQGFYAIHGDATEDGVLMEAGIERARGLATVMPSDADNLFAVVAARLLNAGLQVLSRASDEKSGQKLQRAGANHVVSVYDAGGLKMAQLLTNPNLEDFMQILVGQGRALELAEIVVAEGASYIGKTVPPRTDLPIEAGDTLIAFGPAEVLEKVIKL